MTVPFLEENDQTLARRAHLEALRQLVGNVYPNKFQRSDVTETASHEDTITSIVEAFRKYEPEITAGEKPSADVLQSTNNELNKTRVRIAGRIAAPPRVMGKAAFLHLSDGVSRLQMYIRRQDIAGLSNDSEGGEVDGWELFGLLDHGDFIGVDGYLFITKTGELSIHVEKLQFLAKAMLPMPDKMHGIHDPEIRQRQRYADLIAGSLKLEQDEHNLTPREVFELRYKTIRHIRRFLDEHGYVEVETPMLTPKATGALARPFKTHHNALDIDLYARIAPELYLKRLVVGGFEKVYELNRNFRNEGIDRVHNPEFTMLEFYWAYADVNQMMDFVEELLRSVVKVATAGTTVRYGENEIDFSQPFQRMSMKAAIAKYWQQTIFHKVGLGDDVFAEEWMDDPVRIQSVVQFFHDWQEIGRINLYEPWRGAVASESERLSRVKDEVDRAWKAAKDTARISISEMGDDVTATVGAHIASIFELIAERYLIQPTFIHDFPKPISPLSKASPLNPLVAERFEFFTGALETANGFSELNDPEEQYQRFLDQARQRERGDDEAMSMDEDYLRALSYGMPPAAGVGVGIDRFMMLLANKPSIRDVILFPHMRPQTRQADPSVNRVLAREIDSIEPKAINLKAQRREFGIFLSHSSMDADKARNIAEALRALDYSVWYSDWAIEPGQSIVEKINETLDRNDTLIVLLSKTSVKSKWVERELNAPLMSQLSGKAVTVLPILVEDCEIPDALKDVKHIDMRRDFRAGFATLVESIQLGTSS